VYPGIYEDQVFPIPISSCPVLTCPQDFHHCGLEPNDEIVNYDNRLEVQTCQLDNLAEYAVFLFFCRSAQAADMIPRKPRNGHRLCRGRPCRLRKSPLVARC
jgi:hypothetical protein